MKLSGLFNFWSSPAEGLSHSLETDRDSYLNHFPAEVMYNIAGNLPPGDIARLARVSRLHIPIVYDEHIWRDLSNRDFPDKVSDTDRVPEKFSWKDFYKKYHQPTTLRGRVHTSFVETRERIYETAPEQIGRIYCGPRIFIYIIFMPIFITTTLAVDRMILGSDTFYDTLDQEMRKPFFGLGRSLPYLPFTQSVFLSIYFLAIGEFFSARFERIVRSGFNKIMPLSLLNKCKRVGENIFSNDIIRRPMSHVVGKISALYTRIRG